jgi:hypothetical protein
MHEPQVKRESADPHVAAAVERRLKGNLDKRPHSHVVAGSRVPEECLLLYLH